jgi:hypothetical protein
MNQGLKKLVTMRKHCRRRSERRYVMRLSTMTQHLLWRDAVLLSHFSGFFMVLAESLDLYFREAA